MNRLLGKVTAVYVNLMATLSPGILLGMDAISTEHLRSNIADRRSCRIFALIMS